jgi:hypothetical protein
MRRLKVESTTDSELEQSCAELLQPSNINEVVVTVSAAPEVRSDGSIERVEPTVEVSSEFAPGQGLRESMRTYSRRLAEYRRDHPQFAQYGDANAPILIAARDEVLRQPNAVAITEFLAFAPDVLEALNALDPLEAARRIQEMNDDLDWGRVPEENISYEAWRDQRNDAESARRHKPRKR